jgi:hypothetical protein
VPAASLPECQDPFGIRLHNLAGFCQEDAFAHPLDERHPEFLFERLYALADRGLTDMEERPGGAQKAASRGHRMEDLETIGAH